MDRLRYMGQSEIGDTEMEFYVVYKDSYQYSEVFYTRQRAEEYLYFTQIMEPKANLHIESVLEEI